MPSCLRCRSLWRWSVIPVLVLFIELTPAGAAAQDYAITNLGTLCQSNDVPASCDSRAFDVNNSGQVVGTSRVNGALIGSKCFRTAPNQTINPATDKLDVAPPKWESYGCEAYSINDNGSVAGTRWAPLWTPGVPVAFLYGSSMTTLRTDALNCPSSGLDPPGTGLPFGCRLSGAFALNNLGTIVGRAQTADTSYHDYTFDAFRVHLPANSFTDLGTLPLPSLTNTSQALGINDLNMIVGSSYTVPGGVVQRAVLFDGDAVSDLGTLGGNACTFCSSAANAINNHRLGKVVGWSTLSVSGLRHAFSLELPQGRSDMVDLGDLCLGDEHGFCRSNAFAINLSGRIVGESETQYGSDSTHAFVYRSQTGVMEDLNSSLSPVDRVKWDLTDARGVNDLGQIVGTGVYLGKYVRAYRLDPLAPQLITNLSEILEHFNLTDRGVARNLGAKLRAIQNALAPTDRAAACGQTGDFDHEVRTQAGRGLTPHQATTMMAGAALLQRELNCR